MYHSSAMIMVGDELLSGRTRDANLKRFSDELARRGLPVEEARVVRDISGEIAGAVRDLFRPGRILLITGGMGPTDDDLTVAAVAEAMGLAMKRDAEAEGMVRSRQELYGLGMPDSALKQAVIPVGAVPVLNTAGIAPGVVLRKDGGAVICLPGVPCESGALLAPCLLEAGAGAGSPGEILFIRTWGLKENDLYDRLKETAGKHGVVPAFLPSPGRVDLKVRGPGARAFFDEVLTILGPSVYSTSRDETLEEVLGARLLEKGYNMATAESCTGGGIGRKLTTVPGASRWYQGGVVTYSDRLKTSVLGVSPDILASFGAVSGETALEMARGVLHLTGADCAVSVTGIAGPGGGSPEKPVGTVWTAASVPGGESVRHWRLGGGRGTVRQGAVSRALGSLLELLV
ncbi:MAG TPA: nicotinamide-nucleotide amidohydrolase family protein [Candidatus Sabulitectum sp.]|nr:nicotinamide-nucleotide amidohydrolase family protein [Candidatus Sabulitectum sp.]HPF33059.1 nicotinamide-nucleotide amidohydrolase family protein [Candidatus Sabulitectum sp.]HPJ29001.1 nicotinamide-nucleotide amidohydrolase family protein [Candidatus Sabulitectum sp.]HPR22546.1 nicotinamide-nucleotide amidohydrolase family protein [Candidatus Sabulitectum sp.]